MLADVEYLVCCLAIFAFGLGAAFHPAVRRMSFWSRAAVALSAGTVALALEATLFSIFELPWGVAALAGPLLAASSLLAWWWSRPPARCHEPFSLSPWVRRGVGLCVFVALGYLLLALLSSAATSIDYLLFWGVKAARYAVHRGIDAGFLRKITSSHAVPEYPPLVPVLQGWGCLAADKMPWRLVPVLSALWLAAAVPVVFERLRLRLTQDAAAAVSSFWTAALSVSLVYSGSGGTAEAPLLFFETVAVAWLLTEKQPGESLFVPTLALCGAALTKVEGSVAVGCLALAVLARPAVLGGRRRTVRAVVLAAVPAAAVGTWFAYQWVHGLPVGYRAHGSLLELHSGHLWPVLEVMLRYLNAGSLWIPWIPGVLFRVPFARSRRIAPALALTAGLILFLVFDYLHDAEIPRTRIEWTLPRVSQPALSAWILAAGLASFEQGARRRSFGTTSLERGALAAQ